MKMKMTMQRPKIKPNRFYIDNEYITHWYMRTFEMSVSLVYNVLARHANSKTQIAYPSIAKIMEGSGIASRRTVISAIKTLERYKLIDVIRSTHRVNRYTLRDCRTWLPIEGFPQDTTPAEELPKETTLPHPGNHSGVLSATPSQLTDLKKEIKDNILEKLAPGVRSVLLNNYNIGRTILALKKIEEEGVNLSSLTLQQVSYHLAKKRVQPLRKIPWMNYDH